MGDAVNLFGRAFHPPSLGFGVASREAPAESQRLVICVRSVFISGERVKIRTVFKWAICVLAIVVLVGVGAVGWIAFVSLEKGEQHRRQFQAELDSGRWDFGDQPALLAVAQGIVKNDPEAISTAAKNVPDLQAAGRDGTTLLNFAVRQSWRRPESVEAIKTLLSLGADPNYTNGNRNSFAMADAGHSSARVLRSMLEAGGDANTRDGFNQPMILMTLKPQAKAAAEGEHCRPQNLPGELGESGFQVFEGVEGRRTGSLSAVRDLASHAFV